MQVNAYFNFNGRTEEAFEFYRRALGAEITMLMRFKDNPEPPPPGMVPPGSENKVMHGALRIGESVIMGSDMGNSGAPKFQGIAMSLTVESDDEARKRYAALAEGGTASMPLTKTFFSTSYGTLTDKFGVEWMVMTVA